MLLLYENRKFRASCLCSICDNAIHTYIYIGEQDYMPGPYTVTFKNGTDIAPLHIKIKDDNKFEKDEMFTLSIANVTVNDCDAYRMTIQVTILDNESKNCYFYKMLVMHDFFISTDLAMYVHNIIICVFI